MDTYDPNKTEQIHILLTASEKNLLRLNAAHAGCTLSEYVRQTAVYSTPPSPIIVDMDELTRLHFELRKEGVNLNQLVRAINTYGAEEVDAEVIARTIARGDAALDEVGGWIIGVREQFKRNE